MEKIFFSIFLHLFLPFVDTHTHTHDPFQFCQLVNQSEGEREREIEKRGKSKQSKHSLFILINSIQKLFSIDA